SLHSFPTRRSSDLVRSEALDVKWRLDSLPSAGSRRLSSVRARPDGRRTDQRANATAVKGACDPRRRRAALQRERAAVLAAGGESADATGGPAALTAAAWRQHSSP